MYLLALRDDEVLLSILDLDDKRMFAMCSV